MRGRAAKQRRGGIHFTYSDWHVAHLFRRAIISKAQSSTGGYCPSRTMPGCYLQDSVTMALVSVLLIVMMAQTITLCRTRPTLVSYLGRDFSLQLALPLLQPETRLQSSQDSRFEDESHILKLAADRVVRTSHHGSMILLRTALGHTSPAEALKIISV